jgi:hypothetical protein
MVGSAGASPAVSRASRDTIQTHAGDTNLAAIAGFLAGRQKQQARRPRSPEVVVSFSFGTKGNNGINPRSSARG